MKTQVSYLLTKKHQDSENNPEHVVVIGCGPGGPQALRRLLPELPPNFPAAIIIVQQMRAGFTRVLADQLAELCEIPVCEMTDGQPILPGHIYIVPGNTCARLRMEQFSEGKAYTARLERTTVISGETDRIGQTMESVARLFDSKAVGILLTGLGEDGVDGMRFISEAKGTTIAQDQGSALIYDLPGAAINAGVAREVVALHAITDRLIDICTSGH